MRRSTYDALCELSAALGGATGPDLIDEAVRLLREKYGREPEAGEDR